MAIKCAGKLIQQGVVEGLVPSIIKRVGDDEVEIQEVAWQVLESSKRTLGLWA